MMPILSFILWIYSTEKTNLPHLRRQKAGFMRTIMAASELENPTTEDLLANMKHITFVTSNSLKIREVRMILGEDFPWELKCKNIDLEEPQATPIQVSQSKCKQAAILCDGPVIVEDTSLCFNALNGLPGPYIKWFYEAIGNEGLSKLLDGFEDKSAYAQCVLSFCPGKDHEIQVSFSFYCFTSVITLCLDVCWKCRWNYS